jgi:hypothetical protein
MSGFGLAKMDLSSIRFTGVNVEIFAECTALQSLNLSHTKWMNLEQTDKDESSHTRCREEWDGVHGDSAKLRSELPDLNELMLEDSLVTYPDGVKYPSSHQPTTTFSASVIEVLGQVHPGKMNISTDGMYVLCDMLALILGRLASLTVDLGEREASGSVRVDDRAVMGAVVLLWSGAELVKNAVGYAKRAVVKYDGSEDKSDLRAASGLTFGAKCFRAVGRGISQHTLTGHCTVDPKAVVATVAVIEYMCAELLVSRLYTINSNTSPPYTHTPYTHTPYTHTTRTHHIHTPYTHTPYE